METPLSQKSQIFASSPKGRAKAAFGGRLPDKLQFCLPIHIKIPAPNGAGIRCINM